MGKAGMVEQTVALLQQAAGGVVGFENATAALQIGRRRGGYCRAGHSGNHPRPRRLPMGVVGHGVVQRQKGVVKVPEGFMGFPAPQTPVICTHCGSPPFVGYPLRGAGQGTAASWEIKMLVGYAELVLHG